MYGGEFVFDLQRFESSGNSTTISEGNSVITKGGLYKVAKGFTGTIEINTTDAVTIDGAAAGNLENVHIEVDSETADLTIKDLNIAKDYSNNGINVIAFGEGKNNKLTLSGTNILTCHYTTLINIGGGLTIDGTGSLNLESESTCIGTDSYVQSSANLAILGGNITARVNGYSVYSAISTASMGDILIGGNATIEADGGPYGAGIGSGYGSSIGNIKITDNAYVNAKGNFGAGIGTAYSNGNKDGKPVAWSTAGNITINGNATVKALSNMGAAIGNGSSYSGHTTVGDILIGDSANVEAVCAIHDGGVGGGCGTGIGNGYTSEPGSTSTTENITITDDAQVVSKNYCYGLGLGKGITSSSATNTMGKITFSGGNITIQNSGSDGLIEINGEIYSPEEKMVFVDGKFVADGNDAIINKTANTTVTGTTNADLIYNYGKNVLIDALGNNDDIFNMTSDVTINAGNGNNFITSRDDNVSIKAGTGNDSIDNGAALVSINAGAGNDTIDNSGSFSMINAGAGKDYIKISGGKNSTINAGDGDDFIENSWGHGENILFTYAQGDGNDVIEGFHKNDTLQIGGGNGTYSTEFESKDLIVTIGEGKITLVGGASLSKLNISGKEKNSWKLNGKTATYGTSKKTLATVKGVKSTEGLSLKKKVITVAASALNKKKVTVSDGYTLKLGNDVSKTSTKKTWSLSKDTATYKKTTTAGYKLADNSVTYSKKAAESLATIKGVKTLKGISLKNNVVTIKTGSLSDKITVGGGYEFDFAKDYNQATISGSASSDVITSRGKKLSINGGKGNDAIKILGSATTVTGGAGNDTITSNGKSNLFVFSSGDGSDEIYNYGKNDTIKVADKSKVTAKVEGWDVILSIGKCSLTVEDAAHDNKKITLVNSKDKVISPISSNIYSTDTIINGKSVTLNADFESNTFDAANFTKVDGSNLTDGIWIEGSSESNTIIGGASDDSINGGAGADSLWGGAGNDTLYGGYDSDTFVYKPGEGIDRILDYSYNEGDMLKILKADGSEGGSFTKSKFSDGTLSLTISGGGKVVFDYVATGDKFNINGTTYKIKGSKLK